MSLEQRNHPEKRVTYEVMKGVEVDSRIVEAAKQATANVWERRMGEKPTTIRLGFLDDLSYKSGKVTIPRYGFYSPEADTIVFSVKALKNPHDEDIKGLAPHHVATIVAGHEITHKVQIEQGEKVLGSDKQTLETYNDTKHEQDAHKEGLLAFKTLYPEDFAAFAKSRQEKKQ